MGATATVCNVDTDPAQAIRDITGGNLPDIVIEAVGHGREKGITHEYRGRVFESRFLPKAHLTFIVRDEIADGVIHAIVDAARTGHPNGDGICWMSPVRTPSSKSATI